MTPKNKNQNPKTENIRKRLEQLKAAAKPAEPEEEIEVPLTESDIETAPVKETVKSAVKAPVKADVGDTEEFKLDGAAKFSWLLDGERLEGYVRLNDSTLVIADPVIGYTYSLPITLTFIDGIRGMGRLADLEKQAIKMPSKFKLRSGEFTASMAFPWNLPRTVWRMTNRKVVWAIVQYQPLKGEWRIMRLRSAPIQTIYEAREIMRAIMGDTAYDKLREAIGLLSTPL
jgi:hypothetical protein